MVPYLICVTGPLYPVGNPSPYLTVYCTFSGAVNQAGFPYFSRVFGLFFASFPGLSGPGPEGLANTLPPPSSMLVFGRGTTPERETSARGGVCRNPVCRHPCADRDTAGAARVAGLLAGRAEPGVDRDAPDSGRLRVVPGGGREQPPPGCRGQREEGAVGGCRVPLPQGVGRRGPATGPMWAGVRFPAPPWGGSGGEWSPGGGREPAHPAGPAPGVLRVRG